MESVLDGIEKAAFEALPVIKNDASKKKKKIVPGWSEEIKPFRDSAFFWSQIWKSAGRPLNTQLHNIMNAHVTFITMK